MASRPKLSLQVGASPRSQSPRYRDQQLQSSTLSPAELLSIDLRQRVQNVEAEARDLQLQRRLSEVKAQARLVEETKQEVEEEFLRCRQVIDQTYASVIGGESWWLRERARRVADTHEWEERERLRRARQLEEWNLEDQRRLAVEERERRKRLVEVRRTMQIYLHRVQCAPLGMLPRNVTGIHWHARAADFPYSLAHTALMHQFLCDCTIMCTSTNSQTPRIPMAPGVTFRLGMRKTQSTGG